MNRDPILDALYYGALFCNTQAARASGPWDGADDLRKVRDAAIARIRRTDPNFKEPKNFTPLKYLEG